MDSDILLFLSDDEPKGMVLQIDFNAVLMSLCGNFCTEV